MRRTKPRSADAPSERPEAIPGGFADPVAPSAPAHRHSNERFRMLFERASVGIISVGPDGRTVEANPAIERMLGYGAGELVGLSFTAFTHPGDLDVSRDLHQELLDNQRSLLDRVGIEPRLRMNQLQAEVAEEQLLAEAGNSHSDSRAASATSRACLSDTLLDTDVLLCDGSGSVLW